MAFIESLANFLLNILRIFPARTQLACTCALEHFTASFANILLINFDGFTKLAHPAFGGLWAWHAVEEKEHKAVCYDVYQTVTRGGLLGYLERCLTMLLITLFFTIAITIGMIISIFFYENGTDLEKDIKISVKVDTNVDVKAHVKKKKGWDWFFSNMVLKIIAPYFAYYLPFFHPWDHDNSDFVEQWKQSLYGKSYSS